jgi:hypothetical protein
MKSLFRKLFPIKKDQQRKRRSLKRTVKQVHAKSKYLSKNEVATIDEDERLAEYRSYLVAADQKAQEDYDKNLLTLSGGALGISFAFVKDFISDNVIVLPTLLFFSWISWGMSIVGVLFSFYFSMRAIRKSIDQVDKGVIYSSQPGGGYSKITSILNLLSGLFFITGIVLIAVFVLNNLR